MKLYIILTGLLLSIATIGHAQKKGYYSIGNNEAKLWYRVPYKPVDRFIKAEKGYYHIQTNRAQLRRSLADNDRYYRRLPQVTKGYYAIGNNIEKLRK